MPGLTKFLAARAAAQQLEDVPDAARRVARQCLLDWIGVAMAGRDEPLVRILIDDAQEDESEGPCSVIGHSARLPSLAAARINGAMGHALDYDDVIFMGHPSAPVAPVVLAEAERRGATGAELLNAFIAGFETECRVGRFVGPSHYARGWHSTATLGAFGAAAAAGRLMGLTPDAMQAAFGLAATQAAGLKSMFGTMAKPFHAGHAAYGGLLAARLAARGYTANPDALETSQGFGETQSASPDAEAARADPPGGFYVPQTLFKYHAACYLTHSSIEAARILRHRHNIDLSAVESVTIRVDPGHLRVCNIVAPDTGLACKFSLRMTTALALGGEETSDNALYSDATASRADLVALCRKTEVEPTSSGTLSEVALRLNDGQTFSHSVDVAIPATDLDAQQALLGAKFAMLAGSRMGRERAERLALCVLRIEDIDDLSEFFSYLRDRRA